MGINVISKETNRNILKLETGDKRLMSKLKLNSFIDRGPEIFNALPIHLRTHTGLHGNLQETVGCILVPYSGYHKAGRAQKLHLKKSGYEDK